MIAFNPNGAAAKESGIFGLPFSETEASLIFLPIPWDATASYGQGTAQAPQEIRNASMYVELCDPDLGGIYRAGLSDEKISTDVQTWNNEATELAKPIIEKGDVDDGDQLAEQVKKVDVLCQNMNGHVYRQVKAFMEKKKLVALIGGDHSISLGSIHAHLERYPQMGILQIDAHCDLRQRFEGFTYSHASIMFNILHETGMQHLTQVGVRGFCEEEYERIQSDSRIRTFFDRELAEKKSEGQTWNAICDQMINTLPQEVYLTIDIDGLDPSFCKHTGTPTAGGLTYQELSILMKRLVRSGKTIVGLDLVECSPAKEEAALAAQLLYQAAGWCLASHKLLTFQSITEKHIEESIKQQTAYTPPVPQE